MPTNFQAIKKLIEESTLSAPDQENLLASLSLASDSELEPVLHLFSESSDWVEKISENLKAKQKAAISNDPDDWRDILADEKLEIDKLEN